jgi:glycosyltransferase involved in cell wall biosynthesis
MKYSFVVPTYNEKHYIARCLQSIRDQRFDPSAFEIILSDSNSLDGTQDAATKLCDRIITTSKRGIALGRNLGAEVGKGEILIFVDADAILDQNFLSALDASFRNRAVVAVCGLEKPSDGKWFQRFVYTMTYVLVRTFCRMGLVLFPGICVAYRATEYRSANGFREDFGIVEDLDLSRRISRLGKCVVNTDATAYVSTRRLEKHALSTVTFHVYNDLKYLLTGKAARVYPKHDELLTWKDLWKSDNSS